MIDFAEVKFYFTVAFGDEMRAFALVFFYSPANEHLFRHSNSTLVVCRYYGDAALEVIDVKSIVSVVAMIPFPFTIDEYNDNYFVIEQVGLDVVDEEDVEEID